MVKVQAVPLDENQSQFKRKPRPEQAGSPSLIPAGPVEIECPLTGELVSLDDVDGLIDLFERVKGVNDVTYAVLMHVRRVLAEKTEGDAKTRRLRGHRRACKIEMASDSWQQDKLREAFNSYPKYRDSCLKISTISVALREFKKLRETSGPPDFEQFRQMVVSANQGSTGTPAVTVEV